MSARVAIFNPREEPRDVLEIRTGHSHEASPVGKLDVVDRPDVINASMTGFQAVAA